MPGLVRGMARTAVVAGTATAVRRSGGQLVASGRIPVQAVLAALDAAEANA